MAKNDEGGKPSQPTVHVSTAKPETNRTMQTNDPVTNEAELRLARSQEEQDAEAAAEEKKRQDEEAARQQEEEKQRISLIQSITKSNEGFIKVDDGNREGVELARTAGQVYLQNVQSGPGGLEVEERVFLSKEGQDAFSAHRLAQLDK